MAREKTFGQRLRAARLDAGLSQTRLAEMCDIPKPRLSRYENDHILPSLKSLARLANALEVPQSRLLAPRSPLDVFVDELREAGVTFRTADEARSVAAEVSRRYGAKRSAQ